MTDRELAEHFFARCFDLSEPMRERLLGVLSAPIRAEVKSLLRASEHADDWMLTQTTFVRDLPFVSDSLLGKEFPRPFGKYTILKLLGQGGMGSVYLGEDDLGGKVAIKTLPAAFKDDPARTEMLLNEARSAAQLRDVDSIATIYEADRIDGIPYIAMEYVEGEELRDYIKRLEQPLSTRKLLSVALQLCSGLSAAHERKIIHRDLKPQNIMVASQGGEERLKILDFGLAKFLETEDASQPTYERPDATGASSVGATEVGTFKGTPGYAAPEQVHGDISHVDHRTDQFALGVILYELATLQNPFARAGDVPAIMEATLSDELPSVSSINKNIHSGLSDLIDRLLAKEPDARFARTTELSRALQQLDRRIRLIPTQKLLLRLKVAVAALVVVGVVFATVQLTRERVAKSAKVSDIEQHLQNDELEEALRARVSYRDDFDGDEIPVEVLDRVEVAVNERMGELLRSVERAVEDGEKPELSTLERINNLLKTRSDSPDHAALEKARLWQERQNNADGAVGRVLANVVKHSGSGYDGYERIWQLVLELRDIDCPIHGETSCSETRRAYSRAWNSALDITTQLVEKMCAESRAEIESCRRLFELLCEIDAEYPSEVHACLDSVGNDLTRHYKTLAFRELQSRRVSEYLAKIEQVDPTSVFVGQVRAYGAKCALDATLKTQFCEPVARTEYDVTLREWREQCDAAGLNDSDSLSASAVAAEFLSLLESREDDLDGTHVALSELVSDLPDAFQDCARRHLDDLENNIHRQRGLVAEESFRNACFQRDTTKATAALAELRLCGDPRSRSLVPEYEAELDRTVRGLQCLSRFEKYRTQYLKSLEDGDLEGAANKYARTSENATRALEFIQMERGPKAVQLLDRARIALWQHDLQGAVDRATEALEFTTETPGIPFGTDQKARALLVRATARLAGPPGATGLELVWSDVDGLRDSPYELEAHYLKGIVRQRPSESNSDGAESLRRKAIEHFDRSDCSDGDLRAAVLTCEDPDFDHAGAVTRLDRALQARFNEPIVLIRFGGYERAGLDIAQRDFRRQVHLLRADVLLASREFDAAIESMNWLFANDGNDAGALGLVKRQQEALLERVEQWRAPERAREILDFLRACWLARRTRVEEQLQSSNTDRKLLELSTRLSLLRGETGIARDRAEALERELGRPTVVGALVEFATNRDLLAELLRKLPDNAEFAPIRSAIAFRLLADSRNSELELAIERACQRGSPSADTLLRGAQMHYAHKQYEAALTTARRILEAGFTLEGLILHFGGLRRACDGQQMQSFLFAANEVIANSSFLTDRYEECYLACKRLKKLRPKVAWIYLLSGRSSEKRRDYAEALKDLLHAKSLGLPAALEEIADPAIERCKNKLRRTAK